MQYLGLAVMLLCGAVLWFSPKGETQAMVAPSSQIVPIDEIKVVNAEEMQRKIGLQILQNNQPSRLVHLTAHIDVREYLSAEDAAGLPKRQASFLEAVGMKYGAEECERLKISLARTCEVASASGRGAGHGLAEIKMKLRIDPKTRIEGVVPGGRYTFHTRPIKNEKFKFTSRRQAEDWRQGIYEKAARDCAPMARKYGTCELSVMVFQAYPPGKNHYPMSRSYILSSLEKLAN